MARTAIQPASPFFRLLCVGAGGWWDARQLEGSVVFLRLRSDVLVYDAALFGEVQALASICTHLVVSLV